MYKNNYDARKHSLSKSFIPNTLWKGKVAAGYEKSFQILLDQLLPKSGNSISVKNSSLRPLLLCVFAWNKKLHHSATNFLAKTQRSKGCNSSPILPCLNSVFHASVSNFIGSASFATIWDGKNVDYLRGNAFIDPGQCLLLTKLTKQKLAYD